MRPLQDPTTGLALFASHHHHLFAPASTAQIRDAGVVDQVPAAHMPALHADAAVGTYTIHTAETLSGTSLVAATIARTESQVGATRALDSEEQAAHVPASASGRVAAFVFAVLSPGHFLNPMVC